MKHLSKFLLASVFFMSFSLVQAQDENNPWAVGIGVNAVDLYPTGGDAPSGGHFEDFFNVGDHWNIIPAVSRISVGRYLGAGFVLEAAGSVNKIEKYGDVSVDNWGYYGLDATLEYSLRSALNGGWFDPVLGIGGGYTWIDAPSVSLFAPDGGPYIPGETTSYMKGFSGGATLDAKLGFNFWLTDNFALTLQTMSKHSFDKEDLPVHWQHAAGLKFAFGGKDTDGDGIYDEDDACPEVPGLEEFNGCPDSDGDGIQDNQDKCPNEAGLAEFMGCPDTDGDGVANPEDDCPTVAGLESLNGCPDADGDGVKDSEDECPDEAGPADNNGCPFEDKDNDGVLDKDDKCPEVAGTVENEGCPEPTVEVINELNEYSRTILFDLNKATIRSESEETLQAIADIMKEYPSTVFHIGGHTDSTGSAEYNEKLSRERAASVREFLIGAGIPANRLTSEGYGETKPIASNNTAKGRQENRRVEISLDKEKEMKNTSANDSLQNNQTKKDSTDMDNQ